MPFHEGEGDRGAEKQFAKECILRKLDAYNPAAIPPEDLQPFRDGEVVIPAGRQGGKQYVVRGEGFQKRLMMEDLESSGKR